MMLYIAEKPSLARAVADVLPKPHRKGDGYIQCGNGDIVSWCIGHLLEQATPDSYHARYKKWQIGDLPILPEKWILQPKPSTQKQLHILIKLIQEADEISHVGDPDREGQLLIDEVLNYSQISPEKIKQVKRCLINDLNASAIEQALQNLKSNNDFIPLSTSALARARADWLYGINMSRLCTIKGQQQGYKGVLSVGRVQTPILGLVVRRDVEIEQFKPKPFYEVFAHLLTKSGETFKAKWQPSEACEPYQDEEGRVLLKALTDNVIERITGQPGTIEKVSSKKRELAPPLPYNLSTLQIDMARKHQLSAQRVLDTCQSLYEKHKLITYPRSDCRFLPAEHYKQRQSVTAALTQVMPDLQSILNNADLTLKSKCWDDAKVGAHHAIIPTSRKMDSARLTEAEKQVYYAIALHYVIQFYPRYRFAEQQIDVDIAGGKFIAKTTKQIEAGWKSVFNQNDVAATLESPMAELMLSLKKGDIVQCTEAELAEKETQPPKYFTDATLLSAMTGIARFVKDADIKKILRETDGLGTEATRAGIIELLFKREFLVRKGKQIRATEAGRQFVENLPDVVTTPDMTALWESQLEAISAKEKNYQTFMGALEDFLTALIEQIKRTPFKRFAVPTKD